MGLSLGERLPVVTWDTCSIVKKGWVWVELEWVREKKVGNSPATTMEVSDFQALTSMRGLRMPTREAP